MEICLKFIITNQRHLFRLSSKQKIWSISGMLVSAKTAEEATGYARNHTLWSGNNWHDGFPSYYCFPSSWHVTIAGRKYDVSELEKYETGVFADIQDAEWKFL